jgi:hypothetical protein
VPDRSLVFQERAPVARRTGYKKARSPRSLRRTDDRFVPRIRS